MADYVSKFKGAEIDEGVEKGKTVGKISELSTTEKGSIVGAINELNDLKQTKQDESLQTTSKEVIGAINELLEKIKNKGKIYSSAQLTTVTGIVAQTLLNEDADFTTAAVKVIPANFLTKNKILRVCLKGVFSCTAGATADLSVKLGDITLKHIVESFPNNKVDYYYEKEFFIGCRTTGVEGLVIMQGRSLVQDGASGQAALIPLVLTAPITLDTTQAYKVEVLFNWNTVNVGNNLRVSEAIIEVL